MDGLEDDSLGILKELNDDDTLLWNEWGACCWAWDLECCCCCWLEDDFRSSINDMDRLNGFFRSSSVLADADAVVECLLEEDGVSESLADNWRIKSLKLFWRESFDELPPPFFGLLRWREDPDSLAPWWWCRESLLLPLAAEPGRWLWWWLSLPELELCFLRDFSFLCFLCFCFFV